MIKNQEQLNSNNVSQIKPFQVIVEVKLINDRLRFLFQQNQFNESQKSDSEVEIGILLTNAVTLLAQIKEEFYNPCFDLSIINKLIDKFVEFSTIHHIVLLYFERCIMSKLSLNIYEQLIEILPVLTIILKTQNLNVICSVNTFIMSFLIIYSHQICNQVEIKQLVVLIKQKAMLQLAALSKNKQISDSKYLQQVIEQNKKINQQLMYKNQ
ncbi:hypothetical protein ABPG72_012517 [Tetrahymena utriculariae]